MNQLHRVHLVAAEEARILSQLSKARELYDQALLLVRKNDFLNDEALIWELAGRFFLEHGPDYSARFYLRNTHYAYSRWGAQAKVTQLEKTYPDIFSSSSTLSENSITTTTGGGHSSSLDMATIVKASQAISSEIVLNSLLHNMMQLLIENAGAEKGFFLLEKKGVLYLEAHDEVNPEGGFLSSGKPRTEHPIQDESQVVSALCVPMRKQGRVIGLLHLENNIIEDAFTLAHVNVIEILAALKAPPGKVNTSPALQEQSPTSWLASAYMELHQIFATFNGFMQVTLLMGSDGKDDLQIGLNQDGERIIISSDNTVFLECVQETKAEPKQIMDDFSLLRLRVN